jgi:hypothetical protein
MQTLLAEFRRAIDMLKTSIVVITIIIGIIQDDYCVPESFTSTVNHII